MTVTEKLSAAGDTIATKNKKVYNSAKDAMYSRPAVQVDKEIENS